jgi:GNAT superfamily N-acetyltransferase
VRLAHSSADREAVYRLRYRVYVEEFGFQQIYADHERKIVQDPLDATAIVLLAEVGGEVVGTVRTNIASDSDLGRYAALHRLHELRGVALSRITMTSKLIVDPRYRNGRIARQLVQALFRIGVMHGVAVDFIDCEGRLLPLYERLGYRRTSEQPFEHPELGPRYPLCLWTDAAYLTRVGSAFVKNLQ